METNQTISPTPAMLLEKAIAQDIAIEKLEKLMDLQLAWGKNEARKAYVLAMTNFKKEPPEILKDSHVKYETKSGSVTEYDHASLQNVTMSINQKLSEQGLSATWSVDQEKSISVTCTITHEQGHSESVTISAPADPSGGKNSIQAVASTITYLERYTLLAATGLATKDMDGDGKESEKVYITEDQQIEITDLINEVTDDEGKKFFKYASTLCKVNISEVDHIPASRYKAVIHQLKRKKNDNS